MTAQSSLRVDAELLVVGRQVGIAEAVARLVRNGGADLRSEEVARVLLEELRDRVVEEVGRAAHLERVRARAEGQVRERQVVAERQALLADLLLRVAAADAQQPFVVEAHLVRIQRNRIPERVEVADDASFSQVLAVN